jgi:hypothetical protein
MDLRRPVIRRATPVNGILSAELQHWQYGKRWFLAAGQPELLFTENETNNARLFNGRNRTVFTSQLRRTALDRLHQVASCLTW